MDDVRVVNPSIKSKRSDNEESKSKKSESSHKKNEPERLDQAQLLDIEVENESMQGNRSHGQEEMKVQVDLGQARQGVMPKIQTETEEFKSMRNQRTSK